MLKIITPSSWQFNEPVTEMIKMSSRGLMGSDLSRFVKRAGHRVADAMNNIKFASGEIPIHLIAMGSTEAYGPNRNGDGFRDEICEKYHPTFQKYARWYRNHQNKDKSKSYGTVKYSTYHEPMQRVELIIGLNSTKEAAERNGGLVADKEMEKLARGDDIPVSMACHVSHDICNGCGNSARNRSEYCYGTDEGGLCKAGGLRNRIGTIFELDGKAAVLHADNPDPRFFDISDVYRPADRIAYTSGQLTKAASSASNSGADLADMWGLTVPMDVTFEDNSREPWVNRQVKLAHTLAGIETAIENDPTAWGDLVRALPQSHIDEYPDVQHFSTVKLSAALTALGSQKISLPVQDFICLATGCGREKAASSAAEVTGHLPGIYNRMIANGELTAMVSQSPYKPSRELAPASLRAWATKQASDMSISSEHLDNRVLRHSLSNPATPQITMEKKASTGGASVKLAHQYALYKLAFLDIVSGSDPELQLTSNLAVLQNYLNT
jgi:hypothetical protein